jgi:type I restriction enzyme S subunit
VSKWKKVKLGDVATVVSGSTPKTTVDDYWGGEFFWVTPAEINDNTFIVNRTERKITEKAVKDTGLKLLPKGTVLLSSRAPIGKVAIAGVEMYCNQGFKNLICTDKIINKYLFWFLKGRTDFLNSLGRGATFREISKTIVKNIQIPLPPLEIQKHIAKTLDTAAELLALRKQQLAELDNLVKSVFYDMFGNPVINEKGWEVIRFSDIVTEKPKNGVFAKSDKYCDDGNADIIWISDFIDKMKCDITQLRRIIVTEKQIRNYKVSYGDLLFCRSSLTKAGIGKCGYVPLDVKENTLFECHIIKTKIDLKKVNPVFLQVQTTTNYFRNQVLAYSKTSTMTTIAQGDLLKTFIVLPPLTLQNQFADIVAKIEDQKDLVKKAIDETQYLFDCLMSEYFN